MLISNLQDTIMALKIKIGSRIGKLTMELESDESEEISSIGSETQDFF